MILVSSLIRLLVVPLPGGFMKEAVFDDYLHVGKVSAKKVHDSVFAAVRVGDLPEEPF